MQIGYSDISSNLRGMFYSSNEPANPTPVRPSPNGEDVPPPARVWKDILFEQLVNSAIVGAIAGLATLASGSDSCKPPLIAFGMAFVVELRKYRKI